jgi:AcrR family transcriptional regulator
MAFYTSEHLEKLKLIKRIRKEKKLSLERIKEALEKMEEGTSGKDNGLLGSFSRRRADIIEAAIKVFRRKGYAETTIDDIATAARISKSTFYANFKNKKELFIKCFQKIFFDTHRKTWNDVEGELDIMGTIRKRFHAFYEEYPKWSDMMNLLRAVAINNPRDFKEKVIETMRMTSDHIANEFKTAIHQGAFRQMDTELAGVILLGSLDYFCYYLSQGKFKGSREMMLDMFFDMIYNGIKEPESERNYLSK